MKKLLLTTIIALGSGVFMATAQSVPTNADPSTRPTETPEDREPANPNNKSIEFPADVIDTTISDTSEIPDTRIDSADRFESKDTVRSNWDNSGVPKKEEDK